MPGAVIKDRFCDLRRGADPRLLRLRATPSSCCNCIGWPPNDRKVRIADLVVNCSEDPVPALLVSTVRHVAACTNVVEGLIVLKNSSTDKSPRKLGTISPQKALGKTKFSERHCCGRMFCQQAIFQPGADFFNGMGWIRPFAAPGTNGRLARTTLKNSASPKG